jgi:hypothetical protein
LRITHSAGGWWRAIATSCSRPPFRKQAMSRNVSRAY